MGNAHNISIPQKSPLPDKFTEYTSEHIQKCPWEFAALMTVGDISVSDISAEIQIDDFSTITVNQSCNYGLDYTLPSRAPPIA